MRTLALILLLSLLCGCYAQSSILKLSSILKGQRCRGRPCGPTAPAILPGTPLTPPAGQRCRGRKCWEMSGRKATCKYCPSDVPICTGFCDSTKKSCDGLCRAATEVGEKNFTLVHSKGNGECEPFRCPCPFGWIEQFGKCYLASTILVPSWQVAETMCQRSSKYANVRKLINWKELIETCTCSVQGHLVSIHNAAENNFILNTVGRWPRLGRTAFWIGGRKIGNGWTWTDGTSWDFTAWSDDQPSGDGPCLQMYNNPPPEGSWNDLSCTSQTLPFVCEMEIPY